MGWIQCYGIDFPARIGFEMKTYMFKFFTGSAIFKPAIRIAIFNFITGIAVFKFGNNVVQFL